MYNEKYYFCAVPKGSDRLFVVPNKKRMKSSAYSYLKPKVGSPPFFFNSSATSVKRNAKAGNKWPITDALVCDGNVLVNNELWEKIKEFNTGGLAFHPSVFIDDEDVWHENFMFMVFSKKLDCWDRERSVIEEEEERLADGTVFPATVERFYLDDKVLDKIPENQRLMFKMGGVQNRFVCFHQKIVDIFDQNAAAGIRFLKVSEFEDGDDYG